VKVTYDPSADAAYIYFADSLLPSDVTNTYICGPAELGTMVNLDIDGEGRIVGVEVLSASAHLPKAILQEAILL
jgi:uncharacterized protein YuzE